MSDTDNRGAEVQAVASTIFAIALTSVVLRFYVRFRVIKALGIDDWFMLLAMPQRITIYLALGVSIFISTAFFFIALFQCWPVSFFWTRIPGAGSCISVDAIIIITYTYSVFAIITDFAFTILPIWLVKDLQVDRRTKFALIPILCMAAVASCAVIVRLGYVENFRNPDFLWSTTDIAIWSQIEQGLAITAGSLPTLKPLFRKVLSKLGHTSAGSRGDVSGRPAAGFSNSHKEQSAKSKVPSHGPQITLHSLASISTLSRMGDEYSCSTEKLGPLECDRQLPSSHSKSDDMV
ncbi:hypothetical protein TruAng_007388 [Truncatella angustata]|nr:hypothetical protein TruAng_007388 [Truncatella angustata]